MPELLCPAGGYEQAAAAVSCGADAVYLGLKRFSARSGAKNFDADEFSKIVGYCHERGVKVHAAVNTVIFDDELSDLIGVLKLICREGADAVIVQDLAAAAIVRECCPGLELHASTQMTLHTSEGLKFAGRIGCKRAVLSRELPADIIAELAKEDISTETFIHGALCMCVSGQCYMSALTGCRSANRGSCAQPCRLPFSVKKGREEYALSLKDMSHLPYLRELEGMGVDSFKIEGRMKRPEYAALSAYSAVKAARGEEYDVELLADVFSRGGFTDGYYKGKLGADMFGHRTKQDAAAANKAFPEIHKLYRQEVKRSRLKFKAKILSGEDMYISAEDENGLTAEYYGEKPQPSVNRPCDSEFVRKQLSKLGGSFYEFAGLEAEISDGVCVSAGELNRARRELCAQISQKRKEFYSAAADFDEDPAKRMTFRENSRRKRHIDHSIRLVVSRAAQLSRIDPERVDSAFVPADLDEVSRAVRYFPPSRLGVVMPRFTFDEKKDISLIEQAAKLGLRHVICTNYAHIEIARSLGLTAHGGMGLNVTNTLAVKELEKLGFADITVSCELKAAQINALGGQADLAVTAYGRLPMMLTVNCPIRAFAGCKNCTKRLYDRLGRTLYVRCSKKHGYVELLNSDILNLSDKQNAFPAAKIMTLEFNEESPERVRAVADAFISGRPLDGAGRITRGLYYRGVERDDT